MELDLFMELAKKGEHVSIGSINDVNGAMIVNLLRLGAKSVILSSGSCHDSDKDFFMQVLAKDIETYKYYDEKIIFSFKKINDDENGVIIEKVKK